MSKTSVDLDTPTSAHRAEGGAQTTLPEVLRRDPMSGYLFVFRRPCGDGLKVIWRDVQGACLFVKRLERGRFLWPSVADGVVTISAGQLGYLLKGIDWRTPPKTWRPSRAG